MSANLNYNIYSIQELNRKIENHGFRTARILFPYETENYEKRKIVFSIVPEKRQTKTLDFFSEILTPILGKKVINAIWHNKDCVKITFATTNDVFALDDDDV